MSAIVGYSVSFNAILTHFRTTGLEGYFSSWTVAVVLTLLRLFGTPPEDILINIGLLFICDNVAASIIVGLAHLGIGTMYGFSGATLPQLTQPDTDDIYLTPNNTALFGSLPYAGMFCGGILTGPIITRIGMRKALLLTLPVTMAFWLFQAFSPNVVLLLVARMGLGITAALMLTSATTYVLEISHKTYRGALFGVVAISRQCGYLFIYAIGISSLTWRQQALICSTVPLIIPFIGVIFLPESPRWLVTKGREEEAKESLVFFKGKQYDSQSELNDIVQQVNAANSQVSDNNCALLIEKSNLKLIVSLCLLTALTSWNGSFVVGSYTVSIFQSSESNIDPYISTIVTGIIRVVGTAVVTFIIDYVGRKKLQMWSYMVMAISLGLFGAYEYLKDNDWVALHLKWFPLSSILVYTLFMAVGDPVLFMIHGELLPTKIRPLGMSILTSTMALGAFTVVFVFPVISTTFGDFVAFWACAISCFLVSACTYIGILETKGLSLEEIKTLRMTEGSIDV